MWCGINFLCTAASGGDEMKEKQYKRGIKSWWQKERKRAAAGCRDVEGRKRMCGKKEERLREKRKLNKT